jgi:hypothetical protein
MRIEGDSDQRVRRSTENSSTTDSTGTTEAGGTASTSDFSAFLAKSLGKSGSDTTNEESLFASLVHQGIADRKETSSLEKFEARMEKHTRILERKAGYTSDEKAAKFALRDLVRGKMISKEEATKLYSKAFAGAQLDSDANSLSDGVGGNGAEASAKVVDVMKSLETKMLAFTTSDSSLTLRNLGEGSTRSGFDTAEAFAALATGGSASGATTGGSPVDGANGFLFKPRSDTQGKLVVLLPATLTGKISGVVLKDASGNEIESGRSGGVGNGEREHFRYNQPGGQYPANLTVEVRLKGGEVKSYSIPDPSKRYD